MQSLLGDILDRRLRLVERLTYENRPQSLSALAKHLNTDRRTLANDLHTISRDWPFVSILQTDTLISIRYQKGSNIRDLYRSILNREPIFHLLRVLILHPQLTGDDFIKKTTMSKASIYRNIALFNKSCFPQYGVHIASNPFRLEGEHTRLLLFASIFLLEQSAINEWPFEAYPQRKVEDFVSLTFQSTGIHFDFAEFRMITFYVALSMHWAEVFHKKEDLREDAGKDQLFQDARKKDIFRLFPNLPDFLEASGAYEKIFNFPMNLKALIYLYSLFFREGYFISYQSLLEAAMADSQINRSFFYLTKMLDELEKHYDIKLEKRYELIVDLHNILYVGYMEPNIASFFYTLDDEALQQIAKNFPNLYADLKGKVTAYFHHLHLSVSETFIHSCLFSIFIKWNNLIYQTPRTNQTLRLLVLSSLGSNHARALRDLVQNASPLPLQVDAYDASLFDGQALLHSDYDIIWSNFSFNRVAASSRSPSAKISPKEEPDRVLLFNLFPTQADIRQLRRFIQDKASALKGE